MPISKNTLIISAIIFLLIGVGIGWWWVYSLTGSPLPPPPDNGDNRPPPPDNNNDNPPPAPAPFKAGDLNFVVLLTDDQRADTLWAMPTVQKELVAKGFNFTQAFASTPLCCPSRSGLLTGFNAYNTGVMNNFPPKGGATAFDDANTIAVLLKQQGYQTALLGKYLNNYTEALAPYIPPGWDLFLDVEKGSWFNYDYVRGRSQTSTSGSGQILHNTLYNTYFIRDEALKFIDQNADQPFFLYWAPKAPHGPATAAPEDLNKFLDFKYNAPSLYETDVSDKPEYVRNKEYEDEDDEGDDDHADFPVKQLQSLQAVDRSIKALIDKLAAKGILEKTVIIFAGDNGYMWGEHGLWKKGQPYEESIQVPLVIRMPTVQPGTSNEIAAMNLDIPATIFHLAGIKKSVDGQSLYPLMRGDVPRVRDGLVLQYWGNRPFDEGSANSGTTDWVGYRTKDFKYVEYVTGEKEFYDLRADPYELENKVNATQYRSTIERFAEILRAKAGLSLLESVPPTAILKQPYSYQFEAVWGQPPYRWYVTTDEPYTGNKKPPEAVTCFKRLPTGLELTRDGKIIGTPTVKETCALIIAVEANSSSPYTGKPHTYRIRLKMQVGHK